MLTMMVAVFALKTSSVSRCTHVSLYVAFFSNQKLSIYQMERVSDGELESLQQQCGRFVLVQEARWAKCLQSCQSPISAELRTSARLPMSRFWIVDLMNFLQRQFLFVGVFAISQSFGFFPHPASILSDSHCRHSLSASATLIEIIRGRQPQYHATSEQEH